MKKTTFVISGFIALILFGCSASMQSPLFTVDFENVNLTDGVHSREAFSCGGLKFSNKYDTTYQSWEGFAVSSKIDNKTADYTNIYSPITGKAYSGKKFGVVYQGIELPTIETEQGEIEFTSMRITNGTYSYYTILNGNDFCKKFENGDWFKVQINGWDSEGNNVGKTEVFLADYRNGKTYILNDWYLVNLEEFEDCQKITFEFASSDTGDFGINTPAFLMVDDIVYSN